MSFVIAIGSFVLGAVCGIWYTLWCIDRMGLGDVFRAELKKRTGISRGN